MSTVMIVDDSRTMRKMLSGTLKAEGYEIVGDAGDVGIVNGILMLPVKPADENEYQGEEDHSRYIYSKRLNGVIRVHIAICKDEYCSRCYDKSRGKWIIEFRVTHLRVSSS